MRCSSSLLPTVWCWRRKRLVLPVTPEAADTYTTYRHTRKKIGLFLSHFFILLSIKTQGHTHAHTNITSCRKHAMQKITIICIYICHHKSSFVCIMLWMSMLKIIFMHEQKKWLKNNGEKGGDGLCSVYHLWGEKNVMSKRQICIYGIDRYPPVDRYTVII